MKDSRPDPALSTCFLSLDGCLAVVAAAIADNSY